MHTYHLIPIVLVLIANLEWRIHSVSGSSCDELGHLGKDKWVCVCKKDSCDELDFDWPSESGQVLQVVTSRSGKRFQVGVLNASTSDLDDSSKVTVRLDLDELHQTILGWGGAFTDATAINTYSLSKNLSEKLIESYFGDKGLQYNLGRVPIGGTDFSTRRYTYAEVEDDFRLDSWSLASEDTDFKIPMIKVADGLCRGRGIQLKLIGSPWSAPAWMKTSASLIRGSLIEEDRYYNAYTNYLLKFYQAYQEKGIKFWGGTIQNEPSSAMLPIYFFNSMTYTASQMSKFVGRHLGPALEARGMGKDKFKLIVGDDSLGFVEPISTRVLNDKEAQKFISGLAFHWYTSGRPLSYDRLNSLYEKVKGKVEFMIMSEACLGTTPFVKHVDLGSWDRGEAYALDIIKDLLRHTGAWIDWNMALDLEGGPNWSGNFADSPIIVDIVNNRFFKQPMYYALAHFSRFLRPDSVRIGSRVIPKEKNLEVVAVVNQQTGHVITNILNRSRKSLKVNLEIEGSEQNHSISATIEAKSINSIILKL